MINWKQKKYKLEERLKEVGWFQNTEHRGVYLHAILDAAKYERKCKNCGKLVTDITDHGLGECPSIEYRRKVYLLSMKYTMPQEEFSC